MMYVYVALVAAGVTTLELFLVAVLVRKAIIRAMRSAPLSGLLTASSGISFRDPSTSSTLGRQQAAAERISGA